MPTYRVLTKTGQKGPFTLRVILRGLETGKIPKTATLVEVETGRHLQAGELGSSLVDGSGGTEKSSAAHEAQQPLEFADGNLDPVPHYPVGHTLPYRNQLATPTAHLKAGAGKLIAVAAVAGACVGSLVIGLILFILLRDDGSRPTERVATPGAEGVANQPREQNESAPEASPPNNEVVGGNEEPRAEPAPFTIAELRSYFAEDKEAARRLMGEVVLIEGYLFDPWRDIRHLYADNPERLYGYYDLYLCTAPGADDKWLQQNPGQWISLEMSIFHDKWSLIDRNRRVVIAGRLTTERSLDKVDWKFAD